MSVEKRNWQDAQKFCWSNGGYLAEITSREEEDHIETFLLHQLHFWIGLNDIDEEGSFVWAESNDAVSYSNWAPNNPTDFDNGADCVWKTHRVEEDGKDDIGWHDEDCDTTELNYPVHALCEFQRYSRDNEL